jgi:hypothetical protein
VVDDVKPAPSILTLAASQLDVPFTINEMFLPHFQRHAQSAQQQGTSFPDVAALIRLYGLIARQCAAPPSDAASSFLRSHP